MSVPAKVVYLHNKQYTMDLKKLKELRLQRKISVKNMAKATGMSRNLVHLIESGRSNTSFDNVQNYIKELGDIELVLIIRA